MSVETSNEVILTVQEALEEDVGRNILRVPPRVMEELHLQDRDVISVKGSRKTVGTVLPSLDKITGENMIRMDSTSRQNAGVDVHDEVEIHKVECQPAGLVLLKTDDIKLKENPRFESFLKRKLLNYPISLGDTVIIVIGLSKKVEFKVKKLQPEESCVMSLDTKVHFESPTEEEMKERATLRIPPRLFEFFQGYIKSRPYFGFSTASQFILHVLREKAMSLSREDNDKL